MVRSGDFRPSHRSIGVDLVVRMPTVDDRVELASVMMDAYVGTIDYGGQTAVQALEDIDGYLTTEAFLDASYVAGAGSTIEAAVLTSRIVGVPMIGYVMTRAASRNQGLASALLDKAAATVWEAGYRELRAFITEGNTASETVFARAGFEVIATHDD